MRAFDTHRVHTVRWEQLPARCELEIERGKSQQATPSFTRSHRTGEGIASAEAIRGAREVTVRDRAANSRRRDGGAVAADHRIKGFHGKATASADHAK